MPWTVNTDSPMFQSMSPDQQAQIQQMAQSGNIPVSVQQLGASLKQTQASTTQTQTSTQATQAQIPGIQAQSTKDQIQAQQIANPTNLSKDLANRMPLRDAIKKYTANGGMMADDIFKQYLAESPWGFPNESPTELQNLGISDKVIGQPGQRNTYADRYNARQALLGLDSLQKKWNTVSLLSKMGINGFGIPTASSQGYDSHRAPIVAHIASIIPGAPGGENTANKLAAAIPDIGHISETEPGASDLMFSGVKQGILTATGYKPQDLGFSPSLNEIISPQGATKGGDLLTNLLQGASGDIKGDVEGAANTKLFGINSIDPRDIVNNIKDNPLAGILSGIASLAPISQKNGQAQFDPGRTANEVVNHPVNSALTVLGALGLAKGGGAPQAGGDSTPINTSVKPPNPLQKILSPQSVKNYGSNVRNAAVDSAQKSGATIPGNNIISGILNWADTAMKANPGDEAKIKATVDSAVDQYAGKQIHPNDAVKIYHEVDSGFTRTGIQKETIQASRDMSLRDILSSELEKVAPGWQQGTSMIAKGFKADKGTIAQMKKNILPRAVSAGLGIAGLDTIRHVLGL